MLRDSLIFLVVFGYICVTMGFDIPPAPLDKLYKKFFTNLDSAKPCVTINSNTGPVGCHTKTNADDSTLFLIETATDVTRAIAFTDSDITVVIDVNFATAGAPFANLLKQLNNTAPSVKGVVVATTAMAPTAGDSPGSQSVWNPNGTSANWALYTFSILSVEATSDDYAVLRSQAAYNKNKGYVYPQYRIQQNYKMESAGMSTPECLSRSGKCAPIGGFSTWMSTQSIVNNTDKRYIAVMTSISTTAFFHETVPGALSTVAPTVALLAAAEAISRYPAFRGPTALPILFMFFQGEAFDLMGSRRFVMETTNFRCNQTGLNASSPRWACVNPYYGTTNFTNLNMSRIEQYLYVDQIGSSNRTFIHTDSSRTTDKALTDALTAAGAMNSTAQGLPPSSLTAFLESPRLSSTAGAALLSDYDTQYSDKYYQSGYDVASGIDVVSLAENAGVIVKALAQLSLGAVPSDLTVVNKTFVSALVGCLTADASCPEVKQYVPSASGSINYYPSTFWFTYVEIVAAYIQNFLAEKFAFRRGAPCTGSEPDATNPCAVWETCVAKQCTFSDSYLHHAYSPSIAYSMSTQTFTVTNTSLPSWAESYWSNSISSRAYMYDSLSHEGSVFAAGLLSTAAAVAYFWFLHDQYVLAWLTPKN